MKARRRARAAVLQALFEIDLTRHDPKDVLAERLEHTALPPDAQEFAHRLLDGVLLNRANLDQVIARFAPEWPVEQIAVIDRNILRIALYELVAGEDIPVKVAINEAVELAKRFGSESSPRFVNGVLGSVVSEGCPYTVTKPPAPAVAIEPPSPTPDQDSSG
ncbi:MAG: transcription antitermination factor NusB [Anaerolineae bacterium]